jgi:hypothetical protein
VKTKEKTKKPYPNQSKSIITKKQKNKKKRKKKKEKKTLTGAGPTPGETQAVGLGGQPNLGRPWVHCACTVGLQTHVFFLLFFFSLSLPYLFFLLLDENQLWEGLYFFCAIFLLYVRCHALSGCCKTHLLQMDRIVGFPICNMLFLRLFGLRQIVSKQYLILKNSCQTKINFF